MNAMFRCLRCGRRSISRKGTMAGVAGRFCRHCGHFEVVKIGELP